jgi:toxin FitB
MIVLDTNVISEADRQSAHPNLRRWYDSCDILELYLCAPVISEMVFGGFRVLERDGSRRYLDVIERHVHTTFAARILPLDTAVAMLHGKLRQHLEQAGRSISIQDTQIAAICLANNATLATRNIRDFEGLGLKLVNPFEG